MGIEAEIGEFYCESRYSYEHGAFTIQAYLVPTWSGEIALTVHDKLVCATPDELLSFGLLPANVPIAHKIAKDLCSCPK